MYIGIATKVKKYLLYQKYYIKNFKFTGIATKTSSSECLGGIVTFRLLYAQRWQILCIGKYEQELSAYVMLAHIVAEIPYQCSWLCLMYQSIMQITWCLSSSDPEWNILVQCHIIIWIRPTCMCLSSDKFSVGQTAITTDERSLALDMANISLAIIQRLEYS